MLERGPGGEVIRRHAPAGAVSRRQPTAATYDVVTEGLTGWRFVITRRWIGYILCAVAFAIICGFLSHWQLDRGRQAVAYNALVHSNFYSAPVPLQKELPTLTSYTSDQEWKRVTVTGRYLARDQLFVRNRTVDDNTGFEVLTPLRMKNGDVFVIDRGWVAASEDNDIYPAHEPAPPSGTVTVVARLEAGEPKFGGIPSIKNQIESIDLTQVEQRVGGAVYTGAYGQLDTQDPAVPSHLRRVVISPPTVGEGLHWSYMIQWILFALIGFFGLGYAIRTEFRRLNADDPEERAREAERVRKRALKAFTDEETEDELLDGFIPLSRWGFGGAAIAPASQQPAPALERQTRALPAEPEIYVLRSPAAPGTAAAGESPPSDTAPDGARRAAGPGENRSTAAPGESHPVADPDGAPRAAEQREGRRAVDPDEPPRAAEP